MSISYQSNNHDSSNILLFSFISHYQINPQTIQWAEQDSSLSDQLVQEKYTQSLSLSFVIPKSYSPIVILLQSHERVLREHQQTCLYYKPRSCSWGACLWLWFRYLVSHSPVTIDKNRYSWPDLPRWRSRRNESWPKWRSSLLHRVFWELPCFKQINRYLCMNMEWLDDELCDFDEDGYFLFDCPGTFLSIHFHDFLLGQIELFTHFTYMHDIAKHLTDNCWRLASVYLVCSLKFRFICNRWMLHLLPMNSNTFLAPWWDWQRCYRWSFPISTYISTHDL